MIFSVIAATVFGATALYMITSPKRSNTRRMAWIPLSMAAMELAMGGAVALGDFPMLTLLLMLSRMTVLGCCAVSAKRDAAAERNRRRRREVWRRISYDRMAQAQAMPITAAARRCA